MIVPKADQSAASSRTRVYNHIPYLRDHSDLEIEVVTYPHADFLESPQGAIRHTSRSFGRAPLRLAQLYTASRRADIVYVQRVLSPTLIDLLQRTETKLIFDIDDAIYLNESSPTQYRDRTRQRVEYCLQHADAVCVASPALKEYASQFNPDVYRVHSPVDTHKFVPGNSEGGPPVTLGWVGNGPDHYMHLELLREVFGDFDFGQDVTLRIIGTRGDDRVESLFTDIDVSVELVDWVALDEVVGELQGFDIGLVPLRDTEFARSKCPVKTLEYMAVELPVVASNVGLNAEFINDGECGRLVSTVADWRTAIKEFLENSAARSSFGAAARNRVVEQYSQEVAADKLVTMFTDIGSS